ncbi:MAG: hypothetical protein D6B25_17540 [Desulfobulbaceae bacterium]|nr:MAG: hypothetical protein D6B25_17540 [Desulfobulbaceae bacterium]
MKTEIHLVYAMHRPETLEDTRTLMQRCDTLILEEPELDSFLPMLEKTTPVETYLQESETEYPEYGKRQCAILQQLHAQGKSILQVEPYLQVLVGIHEFFGAGHSPAEIDKDSLRSQVYDSEREATGKLIDFYRSLTDSSFSDVINTVMQFAKADSNRIRLRDSLRADALIKKIPHNEVVFIEAGPIHRSLEKILRASASLSSALISTRFLDDRAAESSGFPESLLSPGDEYTLALVFGEDISEATSRLLCAQALIYNKLITKEELTDTILTYPHIHEEQRVIRTVRALEYKQCEQIFELVRFANTEKSRKIVANYVQESTHN